jgi:hypothetical protein
VKSTFEAVRFFDGMNVTSVIFDIDQTLVPYTVSTVSEEMLTLIQSIKSKYKCCILSNFPKNDSSIKRLKNIEEQTGLKIISSNMKKPDASAFKAALNYMQAEPTKTVMVGDRILTDIIGANNVKIKTILVNPLNWRTDPFFMVTLPRILELILFKIFQPFYVKGALNEQRKYTNEFKTKK